jgi:GT2 family glycosyltransferase
MPTITVITPWQNHPEFADGYWDAIEAGAPDEVIVVDDASNPPLDYTGIRLDQPQGFCGACNAGLEAATSDAVLFLNNDIDMRAANWLRQIRRRLQPRTLVGELRNESHTYLDGQDHPYIDGWCVAALREDFVELGGWDDTLAEPAYYSDNLLTLKAQQAGWKLSPLTIGLYHRVSGTSRDHMAQVARAAAANRKVWEQAVHESTLVHN